MDILANAELPVKMMAAHNAYLEPPGDNVVEISNRRLFPEPEEGQVFTATQVKRIHARAWQSGFVYGVNAAMSTPPDFEQVSQVVVE